LSAESGRRGAGATDLADEPHEASHRIGVMARLRNYFLTGLVIAAPLFLTIYIIRTIIDWIDSWVTPYVPAAYKPDTYIHYSIPGFGVVIALILITLLGFLVANLVGRRLVTLGEGILGRMPIVRTLYGGLKQIFETVLSSKAKSFQKVGLVEYPRKGLWAIVFIATDARGEILHRVHDREADKDDVVAVFLPTTPNPTSGFLLYVKKKDIVYLDMSVEQAAKLVISAGLVTPEFAASDRLPDEQLEAAQAKRDDKTRLINPPSAA
jgi:uncharacterized membrane protein